jgi:hypothetical protein
MRLTRPPLTPSALRLLASLTRRVLAGTLTIATADRLIARRGRR